jgi:hypothetical protein
MADNNEKISYGFADNFGFTSPFGENSIFSQQSRDKDAAQRALREQEKAINRLANEDDPLPIPLFTVTKDYKGDFGFDTWNKESAGLLSQIIMGAPNYEISKDPVIAPPYPSNSYDKEMVKEYNAAFERYKKDSINKKNIDNIKNGKLPEVYEKEGRNIVYLFLRMGQTATLNLQLLPPAGRTFFAPDEVISIEVGQEGSQIQYIIADYKPEHETHELENKTSTSRWGTLNSKDKKISLTNSIYVSHHNFFLAE